MRESGNVIVIDIKGKTDFLLISDIHFDNPKCNRVLLKQHLDEAKAKNISVFINGDFFCVMQGKFDPRGSKKDVRPQYLKGDYLDAVISDAVEFFKPYAEIIQVISEGNHESSIRKRLEIDLIANFIYRIKHETGHLIKKGGYGGWIILKYDCNFKRNAFKIKYFHGSGGGGPVTKGTINHQRFDAFIEGADMIWMGHIHDLWCMKVVMETLNQYYKPVLKEVLHVQTATYKEEYGDGAGGWHIERGASPKPLGGYWLELYPIRDRENGKDEIYFKTKIYQT